MFGEEYFKTRKRLTDVVLRVLSLAKKTGVDKESLEDDDLNKWLSNPFIFAVCGEVNSGKSTLLNGLFGQELCKSNVLPETKRVIWYRFGEKVRDREVTPILEERYRPVDFLTDFNLVDTPGTNSVVKGHQAITGSFMPMADVIFWVFPASNPWGAATWDFVAKQLPETIEKSVFILQQADTRDEKDIEVILGHMRDLSRKRLGKILPVYAVSGKKALKAKTQKPIQDKLWRESGYPELEKYISSVVRDSPSRRLTLSKVRDSVTNVLRSIEEAIDLRTRMMESNEEFLRAIEIEVEVEREKHCSNIKVQSNQMAKAYTDGSLWAKRVLNRKLGFFSSLGSLFVPTKVPKVVEEQFAERVRTFMQEQASEDGDRLVSDCRGHWDSIRPKINDRLSILLKRFDDMTDRFKKGHGRFVDRVGRASRLAVINLRHRIELERQLAKRRDTLKKFLYPPLGLSIAAGVTGALKMPAYPEFSFALVAAAVIGMLVFTHRVWVTRREINADYEARLDAGVNKFVDELSGEYRLGIRDFYIEYGTLLEKVRRHIATSRIELQPNLDEWNGLFLELKEIEQEL